MGLKATSPLISLSGFSLQIGGRRILDRISLTVEAGEFVSVIGPNGAGKTTLLRILATLIRPTSGTVRIAGLDPAQAGPEVRRHIGFLSHRTLLYDDLTAEQNLRFYARLYGLSDASARIDELLERVGLADRRHDLVRTFSRGMQQRLAVARAVLHRPSILLLDEPYTGLDPHATDALSALLSELAGEGCTILLTTHDLERGLAVGNRVVVLSRGRVAYDAPTADTDPATFPDLYRRLTRVR